MAHTALVAEVEVNLDHWISAKRIASNTTFADISPIDEQPITEIARGEELVAKLAVDAAVTAIESWGGTSPEEPAGCLHAIADGVGARLDDLAIVETTDNGA